MLRNVLFGGHVRLISCALLYGNALEGGLCPLSFFASDCLRSGASLPIAGRGDWDETLLFHRNSSDFDVGVGAGRLRHMAERQ